MEVHDVWFSEPELWEIEPDTWQGPKPWQQAGSPALAPCQASPDQPLIRVLAEAGVGVSRGLQVAGGPWITERLKIGHGGPDSILSVDINNKRRIHEPLPRTTGFPVIASGTHVWTVSGAFCHQGPPLLL